MAENRHGIKFDQKKLASVLWVRDHREVLSNLRFFDALLEEANRYKVEHQLNNHGAGHAAINNIGRRFYQTVRRLELSGTGKDLCQEQFLAHLRHWFDFEGEDMLRDSEEHEEEEEE